jgi:Tol biopolymer transport system component
MSLEPGSRLGPYEISGAIGAGGMGEVYRARDTRLDRSVAIKVLPAEFAANEQLRLRFEREAKTISALNDPHICTLFDVGQEDGHEFLVMELVQGESLADRLVRGALDIGDVLVYGIQIAEALDKAHHQGIVHRDLKPGNIMLTAGGVKLLDFGVAKLRIADTSPTANTAFETGSKPLTQEGTIVGTFQYMSPEQLEGIDADARTDIFAFGAVLYEMATGKRAFEGKTRTSLIAAIVSKQPAAVSQVQPLAPPALEHVIDRCLEKDPDSRWQSARDIAEELKWVRNKGSAAGVAAPVAARRRARERFWWSLYPVVALAAGAVVWGAMKLRTEPPRIVQSTILPPAKARFEFAARGGPALSPDGTRIVFAAQAEGRSQLWVRSLGSDIAQPLAGTEDASYPFWSPDSRFVAFFQAAKLRKIDSNGGPVQTLADAIAGRGGAWSQLGVIVFAPSTLGPLMRVSDAGGTVEAATVLDASQSESDHRWPVFLPDGRHFLCLVEGKSDEESYINAASLDNKERKRLVPAISTIAYSPTGHMLYWRDRTLVAHAFDAGSLSLGREVVPIADNVAHTARNDAIFSISRHGDLVYQTGAATSLTRTTWFDAAGKELGMAGRPAISRMVALSHDERRIAQAVSDPAKNREDIWIEDLERGTAKRLTFDAADEIVPVWAPDDSRIVYTSNSRSAGDLLIKNASGAGADERLFSNGQFNSAVDWSADGKLLSFSTTRARTGDNDIWFYSFPDRKARPFLATQFNEIGGAFSPDGRWVAYSSTESGRSEIYVLPIDGKGSKWQISTDGGSRVRWSRDGKQLFFISPDWKLFSVDVAAHGDTFESGLPRPMFQTNMYTIVGDNYDVSNDGKRFIVNTLIDQQDAEPITLVQNWTRLLIKK